MANALITLSKIEQAGPDRRARLLYFSEDLRDYLDTITTSAEVVKALGLTVGVSFASRELALADIVQQELECAKQRCLRILGSRDRTRFELATRLQNDGYSHTVIDTVVNRYVEVGLIDESRYARSYVRMGIARKLAWQRIVRELKLKGVCDSDIDLAYDEYDCDDELRRATSLISAIDVSILKNKDKALRRLIAKGYNFSFSRSVIDALQNNEIDS